MRLVCPHIRRKWIFNGIFVGGKAMEITMLNTEKSLDQIVALCKGRGFVYPGSEIYGGLANTWDYGPLGVELKTNIT